MLRVSKVLADPLRLKVLAECRLKEMSPRGFYEAFGGVSLARVQRAFDVLAEYDWLDPTHSEAQLSGADAVEHFYRASEEALLDESTWHDVPAPMKPLVSMRIFETLADRVRDAVEGGTMAARDDQHISWTPMTLDQRGWETVISRVDAFFYALSQEQRDADARIAESGEKPIPMTVAFLAFESPVPAPARGPAP